MDKHHAFRFRTQVIVQLALGTDNSFERAEAFEMRLPHIGNEAIIGLCNMHQEVNLPRMVRSHLHYGDIMLRSEAKQC